MVSRLIMISPLYEQGAIQYLRRGARRDYLIGFDSDDASGRPVICCGSQALCPAGVGGCERDLLSG